ncbi:hypothetical protein [Roseobacter sp.]
MDLAVIDQLTGNREQGLAWQTQAFETCRMFKTHRASDARKRVLVFAAPIDMGGNTPVEFLLQTSDFEVMFYYPCLQSGRDFELPRHDVAFCAAPADSENNAEFYEHVRYLTRKSGTRTLNLPETPVSLDRDSMPALLADVDKARFPASLRIERETLESSEGQAALQTLGGYPLIIRPVGSHAGLGLKKLAGPHDLTAYLTERDEAEFYVSDFEDYASPHDGKYRKYRIVFVDGKAFPCHMAVADQWDVWYLNADMHAFADKRQEEATFMAQFDTGFGARHQASFDALVAQVGLDYFGIDCAEDADGNLIVFEADNALIVHDMDPEVIFPYKRAPMQAIFAAFERMLLGNSWTAAQPGPQRH